MLNKFQTFGDQFTDALTERVLFVQCGPFALGFVFIEPKQKGLAGEYQVFYWLGCGVVNHGGGVYAGAL